jgi:hypothetical protein
VSFPAESRYCAFIARERLIMDMDDFHDFTAAVLSGIRTTFRTEFTSIWLPIQLGVILAVILIAARSR